MDAASASARLHTVPGIDRFLRRPGNGPHTQRARAILKAHPQLKSLVGPNHATIAIAVLVVATQVGLGWLARFSPLWAIPIAAYLVGAPLCHLCWVIIHEATHKLAAQRKVVNDLVGLWVNVPLLVPGYGGFRKYHHLHHRYQGDYRADADLPSVAEAHWVGRSTVRKAVWLLLFPLVQLVRTKRLVRWPLWDGLIVWNVVSNVVATAGLWFLVGPVGLLYLGLSMFFSIGLHPLGARWIQEHYVFTPGQETYSCYSPVNRVQMNIGYHVEHHDMPFVPWNRLPRITREAPEFYGSLTSHSSYGRLLLRFLFSPDVTLYSRYVTAQTNAERDAVQGKPSPATAEVTSEPEASVR